MGTHSSILAGEVPWTEEPGGLQSIGLQRVGHDWSDLAHIHAFRSGIGKGLASSEDCFFIIHLLVLIRCFKLCTCIILIKEKNNIQSNLEKNSRQFPIDGPSTKYLIDALLNCQDHQIRGSVRSCQQSSGPRDKATKCVVSWMECWNRQGMRGKS